MGYGMRLSCASLFLWEYSVYEIMEMLVEAGIKSVEFWAETPDFWKDRNDAMEVAALEEAISMMPEGCNLHAPVLDLNPASINNNVHEVTVNETLWSLDLAKKIGAEIVTIHPGRRTVHRPPTDVDWERFLKYLVECKKKAERLGLRLSLENSMPAIRNMCVRPEEMKRVLDKFPGLFFTFDVVHASIVSPEMAISFIEQLGERIINVHIGAPHDGKPHYPAYLRRNMDSVLAALVDSDYKGDLTIEIDDRTYPKQLSREEKVKELTRERLYLENIFGEA